MQYTFFIILASKFLEQIYLYICLLCVCICVRQSICFAYVYHTYLSIFLCETYPYCTISSQNISYKLVRSMKEEQKIFPLHFFRDMSTRIMYIHAFQNHFLPSYMLHLQVIFFIFRQFLIFICVNFSCDSHRLDCDYYTYTHTSANIVTVR